MTVPLPGVKRIPPSGLNTHLLMCFHCFRRKAIKKFQKRSGHATVRAASGQGSCRPQLTRRLKDSSQSGLHDELRITSHAVVHIAI